MTIEEIQEIVSGEIKKLNWNIEPRGLYEPIEYTLLQGGKRVRPMLALMACYLFSSSLKDAIPAALAIEVFHNFTLLHDDLMDNADTRRGKPTVHVKWGENTAILSGDVMQIKAYQLLAGVPEKHLKTSLDLFSQMACEICEGQQYDMEFEKRQDVSVDEYLNMICLKTAVLLGNALKIGAIIGGANLEDANALYNYGINIGLAFQLKDDLLDVYGDPEVFGKKIGGDILCNKKTYMLITALDKAEGETKKELLHWISLEDFNPEEKIKAVTKIYDKLNIKEICEEKISSFHKMSIENLKNVKKNLDFRENFITLANSLMRRTT
jgi:geranylgeranyl diphosphate synthase type II